MRNFIKQASDKLYNATTCITRVYLNNCAGEMITLSEVKYYITDLNEKKATGCDGIRPRILKASIDAIVIPITAKINKCTDQCIFPDKLKIANVLPLYKKGSQHDCNKYRPILILPTISKLLENYFSNQLQTFKKNTNSLHLDNPGSKQIIHVRQLYSILSIVGYMTYMKVKL